MYLPTSTVNYFWKILDIITHATTHVLKDEIPTTFIHSFIHLLLVPLFFSPLTHTHTPSFYPHLFLLPFQSTSFPFTNQEKRIKKKKDQTLQFYQGSDPRYLARTLALIPDRTDLAIPFGVCALDSVGYVPLYI